MGADIHWVLERREATPGARWVGLYSTTLTPDMVTSIPLGDDTLTSTHPERPLLKRRDYAFFAELAGVRGFGPDPSGLPDDLSDLASAAVEYWGCDGHSHGHCTLKHFVETWVNAATPETRAWLVQQRLKRDWFTAEGFLFVLNEDDDEAFEYRVVFWFDN